jgi:L-ascorbate metabolism protein UlaG (beta-lactamase superfamily)
MYGGPFLALPETAAESVADYILETERRRADALDFAHAYRDFNVTVQSATGFSLDRMRRNIPASLRGLIDIVYDTNNHPKIRILEEMFSDDDLGHRASMQVLLHKQKDGERPFFLSDLRLPTGDGLVINTPFDSAAAKMLCAARVQPLDVDAFCSLTNTSPAELQPYLVTTAGTPSPAYDGTNVRIRYFGHAALLVETADVAILTDPTFALEPCSHEPHFTWNDLPSRIDVLLISHGHTDHFCPDMLMQIRDRVGVVVAPGNNRGEPSDPSLHRMLGKLGYTNVVTLEPLSDYSIPDGKITALPFTGEHCDLDIHSKQCAVIDLKGRKICLFIDSDAIDVDIYSRLTPRMRGADVVFLGMECFGAPLSWLYGPLVTSALTKRDDQSRRLSGANCQQAWDLIQTLRPRQVFVYAMGQEPWMRPLMGLNYTEDSIQLKESNEFVNRCRAAGIPAEALFLRGELEI